MDKSHELRLSADEYECLTQLALRDKVLAAMLNFKVDAQRRTTVVRLNRADIEHIRERLTTVLAEVGFDQQYSPTEQGALLERLLDRLYFL